MFQSLFMDSMFTDCPIPANESPSQYGFNPYLEDRRKKELTAKKMNKFKGKKG